MMPIAKNLDPVIGMDIHIIQPPGPVPPIPIPHPFIGILFDFFDYVPILGGTVFINNTPRALAGTAAKAIPPHFPIGGMFAKGIVGNEGEQFMGSQTVMMDGEVVGYNTLPVLSCQDIGSIAPVRANPKKKSRTTSFVLPTSMVLTVPTGVPVLIGGAPTVSMFAMAMKFGMFGLGKGLKKLANSKAMQKAMKKARALKNKACKNMKPGFLKCKILRAEPVNIVTGEVVVEQEDFSLPWRIPFSWTRRYSSQSKRIGACGYGWETPADARLEIDELGIVTFFDGTPGAAIFESLPAEEPVMEVVNGAILANSPTGYTVTDKEGLTYHFGEFNEGAKETIIERISDRYDNELIFVRNEQGILQEIQESSGIKIIVRNSRNRIQELILLHPIEQNEPRRLMRYYYQGNHELVSVYDALMQPYQFSYQGSKMVKHTDRNGLSFYYEYDGSPQDARCIHAWGDHGLYDYKFEYAADETHFVDSLDGVWSVIYENGLIVKEVDAIGRSTEFKYDEAGRTISVVKVESELEQQFVYDDWGNLTEVVREDGSAILYEFNEENEQVQFTDPNGNAWLQNWDEAHSVLETTSPRGGKWLYRHDDKGDVVEIVTPNDLITSLSYNEHGNLVSSSNLHGFSETFTFNALGQVILKEDQNGLQSIYEFDKKGRLLYAKMPDGNNVTYAYDHEDNINYVRDALGHETRLDYFGQGEVAEIVRSDETRLQFKYDTEERLTQVINERNQPYTFKLDQVGRVTDEIDYWGHRQHYKYDAADNIIESLNADGSFIRSTYDQLGRLLSKLDSENKMTEYSYDMNGNIVAASNDVATIKRRYDEENNLVEERQNEVRVNNEFDLLGNRTKRKTSYGNETDFAFDQLGRVNAIHFNRESIARMEYDETRSVSREILANTLQREIHFDVSGRIREQALRREDEILVKRDYDYDQLGNLIRLGTHDGYVSELSYDSRGRLKQASDSTGFEETLEYNANGYLLEEEILESGDKLETYQDTNYQYNKRGNLISRKSKQGETTFGWNADNRLVEAINEKQQSIKFGYDPFGRRVFKEVDGHRARFAWDGDQMLSDSVKEKSVGEYIYRPNTFVPFALAKEKIAFYETDSVGLPREIIDREGENQWSLNVTPAGERHEVLEIQATSNLYFQGQYYDDELGLCYNKNRYFNPSSGRFISKDPIGLIAGIDLYMYAPNVWGWIDPLGLMCAQIKNYANRIGQEFEDFLEKRLGGKGSFKASGREFDGSYKNIWYEAKAGGAWNRGLENFDKWKSDFGSHNAIAKQHGKEFQVFSQKEIPKKFKDFFDRKGIKYFENVT